MTKNKFEDLDAWRAAHNLTVSIYKITGKFPDEERFRLVDQICRSSSSVAANLVEGNARAHRKEYIQYMNLARGSLEETKYHLLLARDLKYITYDEYDSLQQQADITGKLISGLLKYLKSHEK